MTRPRGVRSRTAGPEPDSTQSRRRLDSGGSPGAEASADLRQSDAEGVASEGFSGPGLSSTTPTAPAVDPLETPEDWLSRASRAASAEGRAKYARRGLAHPDGVDLDTRALLLRQLYLSQMERRRFDSALDSSLQAVATGVMPDVYRQDAARACLGLGEPNQAIEHLRIAGRVGPGSRRAFHSWTLGSLLYLQGRLKEATGALQRAARWGTRDKPLYRGQLLVARVALAGCPCPLPAEDALREELAEARWALSQAPCGRGYGQFVLGEMSVWLGDDEIADGYLRRFIVGTDSGRVALAVALEGEVRAARRLLRDIEGRS